MSEEKRRMVLKVFEDEYVEFGKLDEDVVLHLLSVLLQHVDVQGGDDGMVVQMGDAEIDQLPSGKKMLKLVPATILHKSLYLMLDTQAILKKLGDK